MKQYPGTTPVIIHDEQSGKTIKLNDEYKMSPTLECLDKLIGILGSNQVILSD
jgi:DNA polymerase-3 subunit alpha